MNAFRLTTLGAVALAAGLAGCASYDYGPGTYPANSATYGTYNPNVVQQYPAQAGYPQGAYPQPGYTTQAGYVEYGRVTNVALISGAPSTNNSGTTAGTLLGAVVGGALGNQVGHGGGRAAATILGAMGGAAVGNSLSRGSNNANPYNTAGPVYRVWVQTDNGAMRTYDVSATGDLRPGDRVRIENGVIYLA